MHTLKNASLTVKRPSSGYSIQQAKTTVRANSWLILFDKLIPYRLLDNVLREQQMKYGEGFLLVYSIESRQSFNELEIFYQQILRMKDSVSFPMIIVGTKCDLEYQRQVPASGSSY
jgi:GTPase SAR1 family protein